MRPSIYGEKRGEREGAAAAEVKRRPSGTVAKSPKFSLSRLERRARDRERERRGQAV
jgi:hypothetical protein